MNVTASSASFGAPAQFDPVAAGDGRGSIVLHYLVFLKRRKWLILGIVAAALLASVIVTLLMTPQYHAAATIEIRRESFRIVSVQGVEPEAQPIDLEFYQTQYGLLQANSLVERVANEMKLVDDPVFFERFGKGKIAGEIRARGEKFRSPAERTIRLRTTAKILKKQVSISPQRASRLVVVGFTSPDRAFSAQVANVWTRLFIETSLERKYEATSYARNFLENRLNQLRGRLEQSERLAVAYAQNQGIVNVETAVGPDGRAVEQPLAADNLITLNRELNAAIAARVQAESRLRGNGSQTTEALDNQAISVLRTRRAELAAEYARLLAQFEPQYPPAVAIQNQIQQVDASLSREESRVGGTLRQTYNAAAAREAALKRQVEGLKADLSNLRGRSIQYNIYQRDVDTNRQLYDALLQRYKEIGVAGGVGVNNISIVDRAEPPLLPSSPSLLLNLVAALLLGAVAGIGLALLLEQADESISDPSEVQRKLSVPLIGSAPRIDGDLHDALDNVKSELVEAYLSAHTSLEFATEHGVPHTLAVTSARAGEGKSTTAYALARSLARAGKRVVLIDCDMRSPSVHTMFAATNMAGVSNYLSGGKAVGDLLQRDAASNVAFMPAGPTPPNAAELLAGDRFAALLAELRQHFDNVVVDIPPVMGLADAPLVASRVEGLVFVVQSHATRASVIKVALERLRGARARILGVVLTKFEAKRSSLGYGYAYGYGYGDAARRG